MMRPMQKLKAMNKAIAVESKGFPPTLQRLSQERIDQIFAAPTQKRPTEVWRSRDFLCQVYEAPGGIRLSFNRTQYASPGRFSDAITWDELQRLKAECGRGDRLAVEVYPPDDEVVDVANMRHLWIIDELQDASFVWRKSP